MPGNVYSELLDQIGHYESRTGRRPAKIRLTRRDKAEFAKLTSREFALAGDVAKRGVEKAVRQIDGIPVEWDAETREFEACPAAPRMNGRQVRARVADWISRLERLYAQLHEWVKELPDTTTRRGVLEQVIEPLMMQFKIPPQAIPTYTIFVEKKWRIAFVPSTLWIVGANGRVNITTNVRQHILFDLGGRNGSPSDWQLVVDDPKRLIIPFDESAFLGLLRERR